ncbi:hypothetical protein ACJRO7_035099 [Eucalyptus globulus]|uniref:Secreted protein n=1 Tax=Eucalyptus globulus TaxID=34317 RepID=A0ABD3J8C8_EUCGL
MLLLLLLDLEDAVGSVVNVMSSPPSLHFPSFPDRDPPPRIRWGPQTSACNHGLAVDFSALEVSNCVAMYSHEACSQIWSPRCGFVSRRS